MDEIYKKVSEDLNIPVEVVKLAYESGFEFMKDTIEKLPLKEDLTEEEFNKLRTNFNLPSLGKLICTYKEYKSTKKRFEYIKTIRENAKS